MNRPVKATLLTCSLLLLGGCSADAEPETAAADVPEIVAEVAEVAKALAQAPTMADSILEANGMTRAQLDSMMFEIAMDPELTQAFEAARR